MAEFSFLGKEFNFTFPIIKYLKDEIINQKCSLSFADFKIDYYFFLDEKYNDDIFCKTFIVTNLKMHELVGIYASSNSFTCNCDGNIISYYDTENTYTVLVRINENDTVETIKMYEFARNKYGSNINIYEHRLSDKAELNFFENKIIPLSKEIYSDLIKNYNHESFYLGIHKIDNEDKYFIAANNLRLGLFSSGEIKLKIKGVKIDEKEINENIVACLFDLINRESCHFNEFKFHSYLPFLDKSLIKMK